MKVCSEFVSSLPAAVFTSQVAPTLFIYQNMLCRVVQDHHFNIHSLGKSNHSMQFVTPHRFWMQMQGLASLTKEYNLSFLTSGMSK